MAEEGAVDQKAITSRARLKVKAWHRVVNGLRFVYQRVEKLKVRAGQSIKRLADTVA